MTNKDNHPITKFQEWARNPWGPDAHRAHGYPRGDGPRDEATRCSNEVEYRLWGHLIARAKPSPNANGVIELWVSDAGWQTLTTKDRLNSLLPHGFQLSSYKGRWYLRSWRTQWAAPLPCPTHGIAHEDGCTLEWPGSATFILPALVTPLRCVLEAPPQRKAKARPVVEEEPALRVQRIEPIEPPVVFQAPG